MMPSVGTQQFCKCQALVAPAEANDVPKPVKHGSRFALSKNYTEIIPRNVYTPGLFSPESER